jgi:hypothetical protein
MRICSNLLKRIITRLSVTGISGSLVAVMLFGIACGKQSDGEGYDNGKGGNGRGDVERSRDGFFSGSVYYLRESKSPLGLKELRRYDFATRKHSIVGEIAGVAIYHSRISRDGHYFIFDGFNGSRDHVIGVTPITGGELEWDKTKTLPFGDEFLGINYDDWENRVYFCIQEPTSIKGVLHYNVLRRGYISLDSKPYSVEYVDGALTTDFSAISEDNFYCMRYVDGAFWLVKSAKSGGAEEKLFKRPPYTERFIILNGERYCVFSRSKCDMVAGTAKQWLSVVKLPESPSEEGTLLKDYDVPLKYFVNVVQPPPSLGLWGVLLETCRPVSKRDGVFYREIAVLDLENGDIIPLFECPKGPLGDVPQVIAWLDSPDPGGSVVGTGGVNN